MDVDQSAIDLYARITQDFNPIHTNPVFAATTKMGGIIAHGTMSLNLIWQMVEENFGEKFQRIRLKVRFVAPIRPGDRVVAGGRRSTDCLHQYEVWVKNQRREVMISGSIFLEE